MDNRQVLSLYELNQLVADTISFGMERDYWVEAELADVREVRGHCYMELLQKDEHSRTPIARASARCWKNRWMMLGPHFERVTGQRLHAGMKLLLLVHAQFHEAYGFSWIVLDLNADFTMGNLARRRQEILRQLKAEGVLELQKELTLPLFAQRIAVISSESAAGYGDFCNQLSDNGPGFSFETTLFPAVMQGEEVEQSVIAALDRINARLADFDAVVIIRGGGATSDMSGFDTLSLAENVANFPLPVIVGIGHDRDECVLDIVAHTRVKTPTAAAAFLIDHLGMVAQRVERAQERLVERVCLRMEREQVRVDRLSVRLPMLFSVVRTRQESRLERLHDRLAEGMRQRLAERQARLDHCAGQLPALVQSRLAAARHRLELLEQQAEALDPQRLLQRGYSLVLHGGRVVRSVSELQRGVPVTLRLADGERTAVVE